MFVHTRASIWIERDRESVFDHAVDCENLPQLFRGYGPIPAIERAELDGEMVAGTIRTIHNSDGSAVGEQILDLERPLRHQYKLVSGIKAPFKWLVKNGEGAWTFSEERGGTEVVWNYKFELTSPLAAPAAALLIKTFFRAAMKRCLRRLAAAA